MNLQVDDSTGRLARDPESFLRHFRYDSLEAAARDRSGMNAVMCATLSGDTAVLRLLAEHRASMNHSLKDMSDLGDSPFCGFQLLWVEDVW